jgi:sodium transport system permease protein
MNTYPWFTRLSLIVFRKELRDGLRDRRSLFSAVTFCWLGPLLVGLLWKQPTALALLPAFLIITAFTGAMNIANDITAGERERGSLEPLMMNPVTSSDLIAGKFLATSVFSLACVVLTLLFALAVLYVTPLGGRMHPGALVWMFAVALPLAPFAAGLDLLICTFAQTPKEGTSYLSVALLVPMLTGMLAEFFPVRLQAAIAIVPLLGQQRMLSALTRGEIPHLAWLLSSGACTVLIGAAAVAAAARLLRFEKVIFGR